MRVSEVPMNSGFYADLVIGGQCVPLIKESVADGYRVRILCAGHKGAEIDRNQLPVRVAPDEEVELM